MSTQSSAGINSVGSQEKEGNADVRAKISTGKDIPAYIKLCKALHFVTALVTNCLSRSISAWHNQIKAQLRLCTSPSKCPPNCKPQFVEVHCQNCIDSANAIEAEFNIPDRKVSLHWKDFVLSKFHTNPFEIVNALALPQEESGLPREECEEHSSPLSLDGLDSATVLQIVYRFTPFHKGDRAIVDVIRDVIDVSDKLCLSSKDDNSYLDEAMETEFFDKINNLITHLQIIHPKFFTDKLTSDLNEIMVEDFSIKKENLEFGPKIGKLSWKAMLTRSKGTKIEVLVKKVKSVDKDRLGLMKSLTHKNLIQFIGIYENEHDTFIVDEWASQGDLRSYLDRIEDSCLLPIDMTKKWAKQACNPVEYLHERGCVHTNISSSNFLIMGDNTLKLGDFGFVKEWEKTKSTRGSKWHPPMPPEVVKHRLRSRLSDIFSLGIVIWEIATTQVPLPKTKGTYKRISSVVDGSRPEIPEGCPKLASLLSQCWQEDYKQRPSVKDIIPRLDDAIEEYYEVHTTQDDIEPQVHQYSTSTSVVPSVNATTEQMIVDRCDGAIETITVGCGLRTIGDHLRIIDDQSIERSHQPVEVNHVVKCLDPAEILRIMIGFRNSAVNGNINLINQSQKKDEVTCKTFDNVLHQMLEERNQASHYSIKGSYLDDVRCIAVQPMIQDYLVLASTNAYKRSRGGTVSIIHTVDLLGNAGQDASKKLPSLPEELAYKQSYPDEESSMIEYIDSSELSIVDSFNDVAAIYRHISAFANTDGGYILFGVDDMGIVSGAKGTEDEQELFKLLNGMMMQMLWFVQDHGFIEPQENTHWMIRCIDVVGTPQGSHHRVFALTIRPLVGGSVYTKEPQCPVWDPKSNSGYRLMRLQEWCEYLQKLHDNKHGRNQDEEILETDSAIARPMVTQAKSVANDTRGHRFTMSQSTSPKTSKSNDINTSTMTTIPNQMGTSVRTPLQLAKQKYMDDMLKRMKKEPPDDVRMMFAVAVKTNGLRFAVGSGALSDASKIRGRSTGMVVSDPAILVKNYTGPIHIIALLTTEEGPHCLHPNKLVGPNCLEGVFSLWFRIDTPGQLIRFPDIHVASVNKMDIVTELDMRKSRLQTLCPGMDFHTIKYEEYDLSRVQLCIIGYISDDNEDIPNCFNVPLPTLASICLTDKGKRLLQKEPRILQMSECKGPVSGGQELTLVIARIKPDNYTVMFSVTTVNPPSSWQTLAPVTRIVNQKSTYLVIINTPCYYKKSITEPAHVKVQVRTTNGVYSNAMMYAYMPKQTKIVSIKKKIATRREIFGGHFCCIGAVSPNVLEWDENESKMGQQKKIVADNERQLSYEEISKRENLRYVIERLPPQTAPTRPKLKSTRKKTAKKANQTSEREDKLKASQENFRKFNAFAATYGYPETQSLVKDVEENYNIAEDEVFDEAKAESNSPPSGDGKKTEYVNRWVTATASATEESLPADVVLKSVQEAEMKAIAEGTLHPDEESMSTTSNDFASNAATGSGQSDSGSESQESNTGSGSLSTEGQMEVEYERQLTDDKDAEGGDSSFGTIDDGNIEETDVRQKRSESSREAFIDQSDSTQLPDQEETDVQVVDWLEELGKGKCGSVVFQIKLQDGNLAAARSLTNPDVKDEVNTLKTLDHECIMVVYGLIHRDGLLFIVLEYMKYGSLQKYLIDGTLSRNKVCVSLVIQVARGIAYLHRMNIVHGDVGTHNCFLMSGDQLKVRILRPDVHNSKNVDVAMFGDLLCEVLFPQQTDSAQNDGATSRPDIPSDCPEGLRALIKSCWDGTHSLVMEDIQKKLESLSSEVYEQNDWKNLDEPEIYTNELQDNFNEVSLHKLRSDPTKISRVDSGIITSIASNSPHPPTQYSPIVTSDMVANSAPESGTFDTGVSDCNSPNSTQNPNDLKATITSDYHSSTDPNQHLEDQEHVDEQAIDSNIEDGKLGNNMVNPSNQSDEFNGHSLNSEVNLDAKSSRFLQGQTNESFKSEDPVEHNLNQQIKDFNSQEKIHQESLPERRGFSLPLITNTKPKTNYNTGLTKTNKANREDNLSGPKEHPRTRHIVKRTPPVATKVVDQSGDVIKLEGYGISLTIPPGALHKPVEITLTVPDGENLPELDEYQCKAAPAVRCLPSGLHFSKPVMIRIPHCAIPLEDTKMTTTIHSNQEAEDKPPKWEKSSSSDTTYPRTEIHSDHLILQVTHFTDYFITIEGTLMKKMKQVVYVSEIFDDEDQQVRVYLHNDDPIAREDVKQEEETINGIRKGPSPPYRIQRISNDVVFELSCHNIGWILTSDSGTKKIDFNSVWHHDYVVSQFILERKSDEVKKFRCKISAWQESNCQPPAEIEITNSIMKSKDSSYGASAQPPRTPQSANSYVYQDRLMSLKSCQSNGYQTYHQSHQQETYVAVGSSANDVPMQLQRSISQDVSMESASLPSSEYQYPRWRMPTRPPLLPYEMKLNVCDMLDDDHPLGHNWKMLAWAFQCDGAIQRLSRSKSPTCELLEILQCNMKLKSPQQLAEVLREKAKRPDVATYIEENIGKCFSQLDNTFSSVDTNEVQGPQYPALEYSSENVPNQSVTQSGTQVNPNNSPPRRQSGRPDISSPPAASTPCQSPDLPGGGTAMVPDASPITNQTRHNHERNLGATCQDDNTNEPHYNSSKGPTNVHPAEVTQNEIGELQVDGELRANTALASINNNNSADDSGLQMDNNSNQIDHTSDDYGDIREKLDNMSLSHSAQ